VDCVPQQLFSSAVDYYAQYRPGYPQGLVDALAARAGLDGTQRVLDIGCGTGQLTIPLARHSQAVVAIDPVAGMLARGQQAAYAPVCVATRSPWAGGVILLPAAVPIVVLAGASSAARRT
jgi:SAM-dependent methyltransferase